MALQVWLPLNGDLKNKGCADVTVTNNGAVVDNNGKIGKCYSFNNNALYGDVSNLSTSKQLSGSCWVYLTNLNTSQYFFHFGGVGQWQSKFALSYQNNHVYVCINGKEYYPTTSLTVNTWTHLATTWDGTTVKLYINGEESLSTNTSGTFTASNHFAVGARTNSSDGRSFAYSLINNSKLNDVRIYDHCLSPKEVKEISQGLVVHYKLDGGGAKGVNGLNLIANGWGGTDNWPSSGASYISTVVPPDTSGIKNSYSAMESKEFIELIPDHSYTMSGYVKRGTSSQQTCYLTLKPYDMDKQWIHPYNTGSGFIAASKTTLASDLKNGDTVVHITDASGWSTTARYAIYIAIFGYVSSTGYVYPDMVYTRRIYSWGTTTDKSNLDKTNNTVTLRSAYSGETIPAGTTVCQSSDGATYYYVRSINTTEKDADEWTFLTNTFIPSSTTYLKAAKYVRVMAALYTGQWTSGLTLIDNTTDSIIVDCSGYNNHGTIAGNLTLSNNTPRYNHCIQNNNSYLLGSVFDFPESKGLTITGWVYVETRGYQVSGLWATSTNSTTNPNDYNQTTCSHTDTYFRMRGIDGNLYSITCNTQDVPLNTWKHIALTHDGVDIKLYINGTFIRSISCPTALVGFKSFWLGRANSDRYTQGKWSDFRIYATALSADDIRQLYEVSAKIDNKYNTYAYEFVENDSKSITKQGLAKFNLEERNNEAKIYKTVNPNLLQGTVRDNIKYTRTSSMSTEFGPQFTPTEQLQTNVYYTFSAMVRGKANMTVYTINTGGNVQFVYINKADISETEFKLFSVTFRVTGDRTINKIYPCSRYGEANTEVGDWFEFKANSIKLEEGTMCTPWIPAETDENYRNYNGMLVANQFIEM